MALKPSQITRRNFLQRAGSLVTSLGVVGGLQSSLMENIVRKASRQWGSEAIAAPGTAGVHFLVEICFRAGFQFNSLFPFPGATVPSTVAAQDSALNVYSSAANISPNGWAGAKLPVYFAKFTAGRGADAINAALTTLNSAGEKVGVAVSETIVTQDGQHRGDFANRLPNSAAASPAQLHATVAPAVDVNGISWNRSGVGVNADNTGSGLPALAQVTDGNTFTSLFKNVPMYFHLDELKLIVGEINKGVPTLGKEGTIANLDSAYLAARQVPGGQNLFMVSQAGRGQAQISKLGALVTTFNTNGAAFNIGGATNFTAGAGGAPGTFSDANNFDSSSKANGSLMEPLNWALAAFNNLASTSFAISLESADWHSNNGTANIDNAAEKQGSWNIFVGDAIAGFINAAKATADPFSPGKTIADSMLISLTSEFTRTALGRGSDNGDGGSQAMAYIGSKVMSGAYGDIAPFNGYNPATKSTGGSVNAGTLVGFDPSTMAVGGTPSATEADLWRTTGALLGIPSGSLSMVTGTPLPIFKP